MSHLPSDLPISRLSFNIPHLSRPAIGRQIGEATVAIELFSRSSSNATGRRITKANGHDGSRCPSLWRKGDLERPMGDRTVEDLPPISAVVSCWKKRVRWRCSNVGKLQMVVWSEFGAFRSIYRRFWEFVDHFVDEFLRIASVANWWDVLKEGVG